MRNTGQRMNCQAINRDKLIEDLSFNILRDLSRDLIVRRQKTNTECRWNLVAATSMTTTNVNTLPNEILERVFIFAHPEVDVIRLGGSSTWCLSHVSRT
jgi:hypothetical protein